MHRTSREQLLNNLNRLSKKNILFDLTPTFYDGGYLKLAEPTIVLSAASREG